ncbi:MAG: 6-bladed beta-propeller, partial [Chloroflexi bacterium]|nr:6-bladed beta-propeller [Chloroflexota bacterium]
PNVPHETLIEGKFNSPHGIASDGDGNIYVAEWLIGGRINKLTRLSS